MNQRYSNLDINKINLLYIVGSFGYEIDAKEGKRPLIMRRKADNGKVAIYQNPNNQRFFNLRDDSKGDAIQFVQNELSCDFIRAKEYILSITDTDIKSYQSEPQQAEKKPHQHWLNKFSRCLSTVDSVYLTQTRRLSPNILNFCENVKISVNGTPQFFYRDSNYQLTGCEYRKLNAELTDHIQDGFMDSGSIKSLFFFDGAITDFEILVVCEAAIDTLSFMQLLIDNDADLNKFLIVGHGGQLSRYQCEEIVKLAQKGKRTRVYLAQDNDKAGKDMAEKLGEYLQKNNIPYRRKSPELKDWNQVLKAKFD